MSQSGEEDTELRDLLKQTLEENGVLAKLRAQLRACVFLALEENNVKDDNETKKPTLNRKVTAHQTTPDGQLLFCLVREFLEYFNMGITISVFDPESYNGNGYKYEGRTKLIESLGLSHLDNGKDYPLLLQLLHLVRLPQSTATVIEQSKQPVDLNATFVVSASILSADSKRPEISLSAADTPVIDVLLSPRSLEDSDSIRTEDTFEGTSSIAEDKDISVTLIDLNKSAKGAGGESHAEGKSDIAVTLIDQSINDGEHPTRNSLKGDSPRKAKKSKVNFGPLSDLPPLFLNKNRSVGDAMFLPSLYMKDFKEKSSLKDIDKLLDVDIDSLDNYEEDFMSGSEVDMSHVQSKDSPVSADSSKSESEDVLSKISMRKTPVTTTEEIERKLGVSGIMDSIVASKPDE